MTKVHDDRINSGGEDHGYSIRVGKTLPSNSANLAYVHSPKANPKSNLLITDLSSKIVDNTISSKFSSEKRVFPDDTFLLRQLGSPYYSPTSNLVLTDEFSVPTTNQEQPVSLYYKAEVKGLFDARGSEVVYWPGGYVENPITEVISYSQIDNTRLSSAGSLLYLGKKIVVTKLDGTPIQSNYKFKVQLLPYSSEDTPQHAFKIVLYTNFRGSSNETYVIRYERYNSDGSRTSDFVEILNAYPFFSKVDKVDLDALASDPKQDGDWKPELGDKKFAVVETPDKQWAVYSPAQVLIADNVTRPAHQFEYRIRGKLRTKLSSSDFGTLNVGLIYTNENIFNAEDLSGVLKKTFESSFKPPYLDFVNPHPPQMNTPGMAQFLPKESPLYWSIDLSMPADYLNDYDLIIITGYGNIDMSIYNDALRSYLENGGRLWIDNAGKGTDVLKLNNFLTNIGFSETDQSNGLKLGGYEVDADPLSLEVQAISRLYVINRDNIALGYTAVNPTITFGTGETSSLWKKIVKYSSGGAPAVMTRSIFGNGTMVVSNCGIFRSLMNNNNTDDIRVTMNLILAIAESKWVNTPWLHDYVYHRDNLFKEEYQNNGVAVYLDDRNDNDSTQIVAKKIINKSVRDALIPYMPSSYYKSKGTFLVEVKADTDIVLPNNDFEVGTYNPSTGSATTSWTGIAQQVIPGWNIWSDGSATFKHVDSVSQRGSKAISVESTNPVTAMWYTESEVLPQGTYKATMWIKTSEIANGGAKIQIQTTDNTPITSSQPILGTSDWAKVEVTFGLSSAKSVQVGASLTEGTGTLWIDHVSLVSVGSVFMTPESDGSKALYAYAVRPRGDVFDLRSEGFSNADVTTYDPKIKINYTIQSFVYAWDNALTKYVKKYGQSKSYTTSIRRSDGMMNLGLLTTLLPALDGGPDWADKNKVFFQITVGAAGITDTTSEFVNIGFFNTKNGQYFYSKTGENVIGYTEIFDGAGTEANMIVQAWTTYYTIRATKRRYSVMVKDDERIYLEYPGTIDEKEGWFLRVHNGTFTKRSLQYDEYEKYKDAYLTRQFGAFSYSVPEYEKQLFAPGQPYRRVRKEIAEYVNDSTIRVQRNPLYVQSGSARAETLTVIMNSDNKVFQSDHTNWSKEFEPRFYADSNNDGVFTEIIGGFDIDYENGLVIFEDTVTGAVKADYDYNNLTVFKRTYLNSKVKKEPLQTPSKTADHRTFVSDNKNWLFYPSPVLYVQPDGSSEYEVLPVTTYKINYDDGSVEFKGDTYDRIYVDYTYCVDKQINVKDYDIQSGLIYLSSNINFKDEVYVNYYYEENFYEYRGYYDGVAKKFVHLDLNPTEGHYCTLPVSRTDGSVTVTNYDNVPTSKLMNKEVYVYMLPRSGSFNISNDYTIRHCYSEAEWLKISKTMPGVALLLGVIQLREHTTVNDVVVMDTRQRGGGLKKNLNRDAIKRRAYSSTSYWDVGPWDGAAYYRNGVLVIQLPKTILQSEGGQFSEKQVTDILKKYIAYGVYPIIEYVDVVEEESIPLVIFLQGASFPNTLNNGGNTDV